MQGIKSVTICILTIGLLAGPFGDQSFYQRAFALQEDRINENQGAESTLAFLLSLAELNLVESSLAAFRRAAEMADRGHG